MEQLTDAQRAAIGEAASELQIEEPGTFTVYVQTKDEDGKERSHAFDDIVEWYTMFNDHFMVFDADDGSQSWLPFHDIQYMAAFPEPPVIPTCTCGEEDDDACSACSD